MAQSKKITKQSQLAAARATNRKLQQQLDDSYEAIDTVRQLFKKERQTTEKLQVELKNAQERCVSYMNLGTETQTEMTRLKEKMGKFEEVREMYYHKLVALSGEAHSFAAVASDFRDYWRKEVKLE